MVGCAMKLCEVFWDVEKYGKRAVGRSEFCSYLKGETVTRGQAIRAKCYECMGFYVDGLTNCQIERCPLYPFMPYRHDEKTDRSLTDLDLAPGGTVRSPREKEGMKTK